jgi:hypothetical protein
MANIVCVCDRAAFELGRNICCFTQYKLVSSITAGSVTSVFCKYNITVNVVIYGSNTLRCVLG